MGVFVGRVRSRVETSSKLIAVIKSDNMYKSVRGIHTRPQSETNIISDLSTNISFMSARITSLGAGRIKCVMASGV